MKRSDKRLVWRQALPWSAALVSIAVAASTLTSSRATCHDI